MNLFSELESEVRIYCRSWPTVFARAAGSWIYDEEGRPFLDFFAGAGALNYGHNNPALKRSLISYLCSDGITHGLDMSTVAKRRFLEAFSEIALQPRNLDYKIQFPGPTGTNSVESALKLARKATGRRSVINFKSAFHGMTMGALLVSDARGNRAFAGQPLDEVITLPHDDGASVRFPNTLFFEQLLETSSRRALGRPAAVIVETVQGEGGINVARAEWLRGLAEACKQQGIVLIVDDVQMGCGRTGPFFSFEIARIQPDIVCLAKSISGYGLPMALTLIRPHLDVWEPGEDTGTFRGNNLAFVTATATLEMYWVDSSLEKNTVAKGERIGAVLDRMAERYPSLSLQTKGRGLARALTLPRHDLANKICEAAFERGLLMEVAGFDGNVVKLMPPLTVTDDELELGLWLLNESVAAVARVETESV